eukprot:TRINITY_DN6742_c0_g1_i6.p1 TRINITY_DN6742_c0_g1~~TRINITY_DN6742_c0_g1_i6.p1  ORF type:complete len:101 (-),score=13.54 TRINITY_DN6742_c0_g1_i6:2136-2438(-)
MPALACALLESWWVSRCVGLYILGGLVLLVVLWSLWLERNNHTLQKGLDSLVGVSREAQSERVVFLVSVLFLVSLVDKVICYFSEGKKPTVVVCTYYFLD